MSHAGSLSSSGSEFQTVGPATEKARRPYVLSRQRGTISRCRLAERSRCRDATSMAGLIWSARYRGACPCKQPEPKAQTSFTLIRYSFSVQHAVRPKSRCFYGFPYDSLSKKLANAQQIEVVELQLYVHSTPPHWRMVLWHSITANLRRL